MRSSGSKSVGLVQCWSLMNLELSVGQQEEEDFGEYLVDKIRLFAAHLISFGFFERVSFKIISSFELHDPIRV